MLVRTGLLLPPKFPLLNMAPPKLLAELPENVTLVKTGLLLPPFPPLLYIAPP